MKVIKTVSRFFLGILLCLSVFISLMFLPFRGIMFSEDYLTEKITSGYFDINVVETVRKNMKKSTELYLPCGDVFNRTVNDEEITEYAHSSVRNIVRHFVHGEEVPKPQFESENLYNGLVAEMADYADENNIELEDDSIDELYEALCKGVRKQLMFYGIGIFNQLPSFADHKILINSCYAFILFAVISFVILLRKKGKNIWSRLYLVFTVVWLGTALGFVPAIMLKIFNLPERSAFSDTPQMKEFIRNLHDLILDRLLLSFGFAFIISTVLVIVSIVGVICHKGKQDRRKSEIAEI